VGSRDAAAVGICSEHDLLGGVVPYRFVATKSITHALIDASACAPCGWSNAFAERTADAVLNGFTAFDCDDAQRAGARLLRCGPIRIKRSLGVGGKGQFEVKRVDDLANALQRIDAEEIARCGVVVEENLVDVTTCSVGQVHIADIVATYYGTQCSTRNN